MGLHLCTSAPTPSLLCYLMRQERGRRKAGSHKGLPQVSLPASPQKTRRSYMQNSQLPPKPKWGLGRMAASSTGIMDGCPSPCPPVAHTWHTLTRHWVRG